MKFRVTKMLSNKILYYIRGLPQVYCYFICYFSIFSLFFSRIHDIYAESFLLFSHTFLVSSLFLQPKAAFSFFSAFLRYILYLFIKSEPLPLPKLESFQQICKRSAHQSLNQGVLLNVAF